jgi:hypothetical protein
MVPIMPLIIRNACLQLNRASILDFVRDAKWCPGLDCNRKSIEQPVKNKRWNLMEESRVYRWLSCRETSSGNQLGTSCHHPAHVPVRAQGLVIKFPSAFSTGRRVKPVVAMPAA